MIMRPPLFDQFNLPPVGGTACPASEDLARQEFKDEVSTLSVLRRFGVDGLQRRPASYGVQDFELDLQTIHNATIRAVEGVNSLPEALQARYATKAALLKGLALGELVLAQDGTLEAPVADVPHVGASAAGASQGEAAAGSVT